MNTLRQTKRFHYAWVIFGVCFLSVFSALGFNSSPKGYYLSAITDDLGIPRSLFSLGNSFRFVTTSILNLFFGKLVMKWGPRKLMTCGFIFLALYNFVSAATSSLWVFYLGNVFLGMGLACTTTTMVGVVVERWFTSSKGTIMGFILAANGLAGILSNQIFPRIIYASEDGWRTSYVVAGCIIVAVGIVIFLFMRNTPADANTTALTSTKPEAQKKNRGRDWYGIEVSEAFHRPYFYFCAACVFLTGMILQGATGVTSAHMRDQGLSADLIANVSSIGSIFLLVAKMSTGACFDRFGLRFTMFLCSVSAVVSITMLALLTNSNGTMVYLILYKLLVGIALPLETVMLPLIAKECFGQRSYDFLMGLIVSFNTLGYSIGSPLMNLIFDKTGTYKSGMLAMAGLMALVAITMQLVITAAHKERKKIEAELLTRTSSAG